MIKQETIQQVLDTAQIEQVVGDFVNLKKRGTSLIGLCPFHNEKTPSFHVSISKGIYKCFGCGEGGDSVKFIMELEKYSYPEAIRYLANKYQIPIEETETNREDLIEKDHRESLMVATNWAKDFFVKNIWETEEGKNIGLSYFRERGYRDDIIKKFELGYSPQEWSALYQAAKEHGFSDTILEEAGLVIKKDAGGFFDRFRGRVMFPIHNLTGRTLGFGGRTLKTEKSTAKYVNSPESLLYHKSNILYGLHQGKKSISQNDLCYLVEGYADVIAVHQAGVENVVASSGTSLTIGQVRLISRYSKNVTILYDGDKAGIQAALRGTDILLEEGLNVRIVLFPDGNDPDSYIQNFGSAGFIEYLNQHAEDFIFFKTRILLGENGDDPIRKSETIKEIVESIALIPDEIKVSIFIRDCSKLLDIEERILLLELNRIRNKNSKKNSASSAAATSSTAGSASDYHPYPDVDPEGIPSHAPDETQKANTLTTLIRQEEEFIRVLLLYGEIIPNWENVEGFPIAPLLINSISDIPFKGNTTNKILEIYKEYIQKEEIPKNSLFTSHTNRAIANLSISLLSEKYNLSENWNDDKRNIYVTHEKEKLEDLVYSLVFRLKKRWIEQQMHEIREEMNTNTAEIENLLQKYMKLKTDLKEIGDKLGTIVLK